MTEIYKKCNDDDGSDYFNKDDRDINNKFEDDNGNNAGGTNYDGFHDEKSSDDGDNNNAGHDIGGNSDNKDCGHRDSNDCVDNKADDGSNDDCMDNLNGADGGGNNKFECGDNVNDSGSDNNDGEGVGTNDEDDADCSDDEIQVESFCDLNGGGGSYNNVGVDINSGYTCCADGKIKVVNSECTAWDDGSNDDDGPIDNGRTDTNDDNGGNGEDGV